MITDLTYSLCF